MKPSFKYQLFGLEPRDIAVYEAMLKLDNNASIRTIALATNSNRGTTFEVIKKLTELGLVSSRYRGTRKYYAAESPNALKQYAADRQQAFDDEITEFNAYADQLASLRPANTSRQFSRVYEGQAEIAALLQDVLTTIDAASDKTYRVISSAEISNVLYGNFRNFTRQRIKKGIAVKVIGVGRLGAEAKLAERKQLTATAVPASYIIIYGHKIAQITLTNLGEIQGSVIEDVGIAQLQGLLFDELWNKL